MGDTEGNTSVRVRVVSVGLTLRALMRSRREEISTLVPVSIC